MTILCSSVLLGVSHPPETMCVVSCFAAMLFEDVIYTFYQCEEFEQVLSLAWQEITFWSDVFSDSTTSWNSFHASIGPKYWTFLVFMASFVYRLNTTWSRFSLRNLLAQGLHEQFGLDASCFTTSHVPKAELRAIQLPQRIPEEEINGELG